MTLEPGELGDRAGKRDRAHLQPADIVEAVVLERLIGQFGQQAAPSGSSIVGLRLK